MSRTPTPEQLRVIATIMEAVQEILGYKYEVAVVINGDNTRQVAIEWDWEDEE